MRALPRLLPVSTLFLGLTLAPGLGRAQTPPAAAAQPAEQFPKPQPGSLSVSQIPGRLEVTAALLRGANTRATPEGDMLRIIREFPDFAESVRAMIASTRDGLRSGLSLAQLRDSQDTWDLARTKLTEWQSVLTNRSAGLSSDLQALRHEDDVWTATAASSGALNLPADINARITQIGADLDSVEKIVLDRRDAILGQQSKIADLQIEVDSLSEQVSAAVGQRRESLIELDSPPLWRGASGPVAGPAGPDTWTRLFETHPGVLSFYTAEFLQSVVLLVSVCLAILLGLLLQRRQLLHYAEDPDPSLRALAAVAARPVAASFLLTITLGTLVRSVVSGTLASLAWYLLLIPMLRLLPRLMPLRGAYQFWILALFFVGDHLIALLPRQSLEVRLSVLAQSALAAAALVWLYRHLPVADSPRWMPLIRRIIWAAVFLLAVSATANLIGLFALGRFLSSGVVSCFYFGVLLHGTGIVLRGFVGLALQSRGARYLIHAGETSRTIQTRLSQVVGVVIFLLFMVVALRAFSLWTPISTWIESVFEAGYSIGAFRFTLGDIATVLLLLAFSYLLSQSLRFFLQVTVYPRLNLQLGTARAASKVLHYTIMLVGFLCAMAAAGMEISKLVVLFSAFGVGIGFGLQNIVNNFVSGLILLFERPLQVGDQITVGDTSGMVSDIGIRASKIHTGEGADVLIPNGQLMSQQFINWTLSDPRRRADLAIGVAYGNAPERVIELVRQVALADARVLRNPEPDVLFADFGDNAQNFILRFWCTVDDHVAVTSSLRIALTSALAKAGIEMPFPQRDLNIRSIAPGVLDAVRDKSQSAEA